MPRRSVQRFICYHAFVVEATAGGRNNRMQRTRRRPREPDGGPAAGVFDLGRYPGGGHAPAPRILSQRGGRRGPADYRHRLRRDRRRQGHRHAGGRGLHFCLEATGPDSDSPATALADAGRLVSVANPADAAADGALGS